MRIVAAVAIAAAFTLPAKADDLEKKIIDACASFAPFSVAQRGECINTIMADNSDFLIQIERPEGKRIMAECEKLGVSEQFGRYVELRMCFRRGFVQELAAEASVRGILGDIPQDSNSRKVMAEPCVKELEQTGNYTAALACLQGSGDDTIWPSDANIKRLVAAMGSKRL